MQESNLTNGYKSVAIQLFQSYYPHPMDYQQVIACAGLQDMQNRYTKKLSGGEKQRLLFALSICGNPKLRFLDEPSVGMDVEARQGLWQAIRDLRAKGTGIVLTDIEIPCKTIILIAFAKSGYLHRAMDSGLKAIYTNHPRGI